MRSLTLGLMGLDEMHLRVLATSSENAREKANAQKGARTCSAHCDHAKNAEHSPQADAERAPLGSCGMCSRIAQCFSDIKAGLVVGQRRT